MAPEEQFQVSCDEGDKVEEVGDCVDRGVGGLVPLEVLHDEAVDCLHDQVELEHDQVEEVGDFVTMTVLGVGRVDRETGEADVPGGGLVNRVADGVWQHQARADPGGEGPILYPYSPSDIFCFLCL